MSVIKENNNDDIQVLEKKQNTFSECLPLIQNDIYHLSNDKFKDIKFKILEEKKPELLKELYKYCMKIEEKFFLLKNMNICYLKEQHRYELLKKNINNNKSFDDKKSDTITQKLEKLEIELPKIQKEIKDVRIKLEERERVEQEEVKRKREQEEVEQEPIQFTSSKVKNENIENDKWGTDQYNQQLNKSINNESNVEESIEQERVKQEEVEQEREQEKIKRKSEHIEQERTNNKTYCDVIKETNKIQPQRGHPAAQCAPNTIPWGHSPPHSVQNSVWQSNNNRSDFIPYNRRFSKSKDSRNVHSNDIWTSKSRSKRTQHKRVCLKFNYSNCYDNNCNHRHVCLYCGNNMHKSKECNKIKCYNDVGLICLNFNNDICNLYNKCKYKHICLYCSSSKHKKHNCTE